MYVPLMMKSRFTKKSVLNIIDLYILNNYLFWKFTLLYKKKYIEKPQSARGFGPRSFV